MLILKKINLWLATHNKNKIKEFHNLLSDWPFCLKTVDQLSQPYDPPEESGRTFLENARIKMNCFLKLFPSEYVLAEDSGFEVECLGGRPGIHSARYHKGKSLEERLGFLLEEVAATHSQNRNVKMTSVVLMNVPKIGILQAMGIIDGTLSKEMRGNQGFVYDHIFIPKGESQTIAELGYPYKNQFSHRFLSVQKLKKKVEPYLKKIQNHPD